jgi:hypothetical protein
VYFQGGRRKISCPDSARIALQETEESTTIIYYFQAHRKNVSLSSLSYIHSKQYNECSFNTKLI